MPAARETLDDFSYWTRPYRDFSKVLFELFFDPSNILRRSPLHIDNLTPADRFASIPVSAMCIMTTP